MPKTRLISPGSIPNHKLLKNLQLQGNYISNDGGDEGISIDDDGDVTLGGDLTTANLTMNGSLKNASGVVNITKGSILDDDLFQSIQWTYASNRIHKWFYDTTNYFKLHIEANGVTTLSTVDASVGAVGHLILDVDGDVILDPYSGITKFYKNGDTDDLCTLTVAANGATTIATADSDGEVGHLTIAPDGDTIIDRNTALTATGTAKGLHIDYDHTGISASGQTVTGIGLDLDMNCESVTHVGTVNQTGIDLDMVAATDGVQINTGLDIDVSGGDKTFGLMIDTNVGSGSSSIGIYLDNLNGGTDFKNVSSADASDYFMINTIAAGATTLTTVDATVGATAHLTLDPDGDLIFSGCDVVVDENKKLYLDGGGDTYITSPAADSVGIKVGDDYLLTLSEYGLDGNEALFKESCATFTRQESSFHAVNCVVDFRHSNKYRLEMTDDITNIKLYFPKGSGNFLLVCTTDGDHDVTNWKAYEFDESAATTTDVLWAGGSVPAFTSSGVDIVSFYWDANEQQCYGVASLAFATP